MRRGINLFYYAFIFYLFHFLTTCFSALCTLEIPKATLKRNPVHTIHCQEWLVSVSVTRSLDICVGLLLSIIKSYGLHRSTSVWVGSWALDTGQKQTQPIIDCSTQSLHSPLPGRLEWGNGKKCNWSMIKCFEESFRTIIMRQDQDKDYLVFRATKSLGG